jgi:hypothetical protein
VAIIIASLFSIGILVDFYKEKTIQGRQKRKAPKGKSESLWSFCIGIFQIVFSVFPPR